MGPAALAADTIRVATFQSGLKRDGPGLLLRDILAGDDPQILTARDMIVAVNPDILLLTRFDYDRGLSALSAFNNLIGSLGDEYPYVFANIPNSGLASGADINQDGWLGGEQDAQGFGKFAGHGGMAILSRYPIDAINTQDFSTFLWRDLPSTTMPDGELFGDIQRLSSTAHWDVPILLPGGGVLHLLAYHATTPAFGDRNALRNADETAFWLRYLDGELSQAPPQDQFVIMGDANLDPLDGVGQHAVIKMLLDDPRVQDPRPKSRGAVVAAHTQRGVNLGHIGDPALDTADWRDVDGPGNLRVDYVLPSADLTVLGAGVFWPAPDEPDAVILADRDPLVSWHGLVWVDLGG